MTGSAGLRLLLSDAAENLERPPDRRALLMGLAVSRGVQVAALYRFAHALHRRGHRLAALLVTRLMQHLYACDIHPAAVIGPGLVLRHPVGVVIGAECVLGSRVRIFQNVTCGKRMTTSSRAVDGMPTLGDDVHLFAGAVVLGPVHVGRGAWVGANCVVMEDCPEGGRLTAPQPRLRVARG